MSGGDLPLSDVKVLDFTWVVAAPAASRVMADYGATVVRVETAKRIDTARTFGPFFGDPGAENSILWQTLNAGKLGVTLDLSSEGGRAVALAEMALAGDLGATIEAPGSAPEDAGETPLHAWLFGEDQARYLVTAPGAEEVAESLLEAARAAGVPAARIGVTGGPTLILPGGAPILLGELRAAHEGWLPRYMGD